MGVFGGSKFIEDIFYGMADAGIQQNDTTRNVTAAALFGVFLYGILNKDKKFEKKNGKYFVNSSGLQLEVAIDKNKTSYAFNVPRLTPIKKEVNTGYAGSALAYAIVKAYRKN